MGPSDRLLKAEPPATALEALNAGQSAEQLLEQGMELEQLGQLDEALQCYESAIALMPELARAHFNRGIILLDRGDAQDALDAFTKAVQYKPDSAGAHFNMGAAYVRLDRHEAAIAAYRQAIALKPDFAEAHMALGGALEALGEDEAAISTYRRALEIKPDYAEAHHRLVKILLQLDRLDEVAACYRQMLEFDRSNVELLNNLGLILNDLGNLQEAAACFRSAVQLNPDLVSGHGNLGNVLLGLHLYVDAMASYRRVLEIDPDNADAHNNLGNVFKEIGQLEAAEASYRNALTSNPDSALARSNLLLVKNYLADQPVEQLLGEARQFGERVMRQAPSPLAFMNRPDVSKCLRVGFVSADLRSHPVGFFLDSVLAALATEAAGRLELFAYSNSRVNDPVTDRIKRHFDGWYSAVEQSDEFLARRIRDDGIDILIDLSGHTGNNRLPVFAWKPAPVQASWLGYCATTGVSEVDYYIADAIALPHAHERQFTETILRLPECYLCLSKPAYEIPISISPAFTTGRVTFGSFNNLTKMNAETVHLWARVLKAVPESRLFLKSRQLGDEGVLKTTLARYADHGVGPNRLILEGHIDERGGHLAAYNRVDIALDPSPYNGVTTTAEALWMGVPVLTLAGDRFLARQGMSLLMNAGLPGWIADSPDDYVSRAVSHATDLPRLALLRAGMRKQVRASPIFDAPRFAKNFEVGLRSIWGKWCIQQLRQCP